MARKKKTIMMGAFLAGALLFAGTALADIMDQSGYDQLKGALKTTAQNCTEKYDSFTMDMSMKMQDNGQVIISEQSTIKYDLVNHREESNNKSVDKFHKWSHDLYHYTDREQTISKSADNENYVVTTFVKKREEPLLSAKDNPFNEEEAKDLERIFDILVHNLKDQVLVTENPDGSKDFQGKLSEGQIPALVNAVASFQMKQQFNGRSRGGVEDSLNLTSDVYVKEVWGTAKVREDGSLEHILGKISVSGIDKDGAVHELTFEVLFELSGVNATKVTKPDLTGKKVIAESERDWETESRPTAEKFVRDFKNDIVLIQEGSFVKIGERHIEITGLNEKEVQGSYWEEYKEGFANYEDEESNFTFKGKISKEDPRNVFVEGLTAAGQKISGNMHFDGYAGQIYFHMDNNQSRYTGDVNYDGDFRPDFD